MIIINPNSGPGVDAAGWLPDKRYMKEIHKLKAYDNVTLIGYVRLDYCRRDIKAVREDLAKYANWSTHSPNFFEKMIGIGRKELARGGVFFDEVPNLYTDEIAEYLISLGKMVKTIDGIEGTRLVSTPIRSTFCGSHGLKLTD